MGSGKGRSKGTELEGENKRGGGVEGLKPMWEGDGGGGCVGSAVRKLFCPVKFSYRTISGTNLRHVSGSRTNLLYLKIQSQFLMRNRNRDSVKLFQVLQDKNCF